MIFGIDSSREVTKECLALSVRKALLVTDKGVENAGIADRIRNELSREVAVQTFNEVEPEPSIQTGEKAAEAVRRYGFDAVVGVGGGSALDVAKIASLAATNSGRLANYVKGIFNNDVFPKKGLPTIMLPTTAGSGSDVAPGAMLIVGHAKVFLQGDLLFPDVTIVDPKLTVSMPPNVTAASGCDAISHAIEAFLSKGANPLTDLYALEAIRLIGGHLRQAYAYGSDLKVRNAMSWAALLAGLALRAGMTYGHSVGYTIAGRYKLPHGVSTAIALPYIMEYNLPARQERLSEIARALGQKIDRLSQLEAAPTAIRAIAELLDDLGIPRSLKSLGATTDVLKELADECVRQYPRPLNPRPMNESDALALYERMFEGKLLQ